MKTGESLRVSEELPRRYRNRDSMLPSFSLRPTLPMPEAPASRKTGAWNHVTSINLCYAETGFCVQLLHLFQRFYKRLGKLIEGEE